MNEPHMIQACPECNSSDVYWRGRAKNYRCFACHAVFEAPVERFNKQGLMPPTAERRERCRAREAKRQARDARYRDTRPARMAANWDRKIAEAKAKWHEKFDRDMPSQNIP